ncbi:MAG TPA: flippase-like domain-containing protein [Streptosporangiaceae bacterium]|nr:flippase-like domain-containing protein [Streptosporangiaceae bacterium]
MSRTAKRTAALVVNDHLEPRIRIPSDLLRCLTALVELAVLLALGLVAKATTTGVGVDVVGVSQHLAKGLIGPLHSLAFIALLGLPVALAIRLVMIGQLRRLGEAVVIAVIAGGVTVACNALLRLGSLSQVHAALAAGAPHGSNTLDQYLTGLAAYLTVIGMSGRPRWRTWFWLAIGFYSLTSLALEHKTSTVLSLLITLLIGAAVGSGLRYVIGTNSDRPTAEEIAAVLSIATEPIVEIQRVPDSGTGNRRYSAGRADGSHLDVTVFDRDQQAADALYRIYRRLRVTSQAARSVPVTVSRAIERSSLMAYAVEDAGVPTPRLRAALRVGPEAAAIATSHHDGTTLANHPAPTDRMLGHVFEAVLKLHRHRVTHRALTADRILLTGRDDETVMLLEPGDGDVAASDLQLRLDLSQLTATVALLVGPDRAASLARHKLGQAAVSSLVPLLQPVVLHRSTRMSLRKHKELLPTLRKQLVGAVPQADVPPVQLERVRLRSVLTLVATIFAAYIVLGQLGSKNLGHVLKHSDWTWLLFALALSAITYVGAAWSLSGFVLEKLRFVRTFLAQLAGSFVTLVTPAAVGGVALNIRYLSKSKVAPADAASSVGVSQVFAFALHILLLVIFIAATGGSDIPAFRPPSWAYIALAGLGVVILGVLAVPAGRQLVRSRVAPALGQVIPRLLDIAQKPAKLAEGIGGALILTFAYILCLDVCLRAVGTHANFFAIGVVYLTGSALGSIVPTPGGLGAVEVALSGGLTAIAHVPGAYALSAVLVFRLITFWLPIPIGWLALNYLQHRDAL